jgi:hypothetical protein
MLDFYLKHVRDFRSLTGLPLDSGADADHTLHLMLLAEESLEYASADDLAGRADALADSLVVACGYLLDAGELHVRIDVAGIIAELERVAIRDGVNLAAAFLLVHESNMSKLIVGERELRATQAKYESIGVPVEFMHVGESTWGPVMAAYCSEDCSLPKGKLLKGASYHQPDWSVPEIWMLDADHKAGSPGAGHVGAVHATGGVF